VEFELSDDQQALADAARSLLDGLASPAQVRTHLASGEPYDAKLWRSMAEQGWTGVAVPAELGGLGLGFVEAVVLLEQVGRHAAPAPFLPTLLALSALIDVADVPQVTAWLAELLARDAVGCVAWASRPDALRSEGTEPSGWLLSGRTDPVVAGPAADIAVVWTPDGVYLADLRAIGRPKAEPAMDLTQSLGWLTFDHTPVVRLGGPAAATRLLDRAAVAWSAELLGGASRVLELSSDYAKVRVQFDRPIGSFQAVKHRCADMVVDVEGMRSSTWYGAWCLAAAHPDASVAASAAKVWCADAAKRVMASGLQVHGGIGFTWEHDLHLYLKRSQLAQVSFGDAVYHRERLAGLLRQRIEVGAPLI
jgi:alkylation response protein AidB-like acyl-CoA dehydrogenase